MGTQSNCTKCGEQISDQEPHECKKKIEIIVCGLCSQPIKGDPSKHKCDPVYSHIHKWFTTLHKRILLIERDIGFQPKDPETKRMTIMEKVEKATESIEEATKELEKLKGKNG